MKKPTLFTIMAIGGGIGLAASFMQMLEKIQLLKDADKVLVCDINAVFSCSTVLTAWQSSVFGFPNSLMCIIFFTLFTTIGIVGATKVVLPRNLRLVLHGLAVGMLCFGIWFLLQSIFVIQALCILCLFCFSGLLALNWAWLRINAQDLPLPQSVKAPLQYFIAKDYDTFGWAMLALLLVLAMVLKFGL